ncbi:YraN family protein [Candidatus Microgenomates bacterium]|nr:YraN family protein [Candidatus Microgenomates bacterium]
MPTRNNLVLGKYGEEAASKYLKSQGYKILERNFRKSYSEIDLVALDGKTLVIIEVKTRIGDKYGLPEEAITPRKLRSLTKAAYYYQMLHPKLPESLRIDVVSVNLGEDFQVLDIRLYKNITGG